MTIPSHLQSCSYSCMQRITDFTDEPLQDSSSSLKGRVSFCGRRGTAIVAAFLLIPFNCVETCYHECQGFRYGYALSQIFDTGDKKELVRLRDLAQNHYKKSEINQKVFMQPLWRTQTKSPESKKMN